MTEQKLTNLARLVIACDTALLGDEKLIATSKALRARAWRVTAAHADDCSCELCSACFRLTRTLERYGVYQ